MWLFVFPTQGCKSLGSRHFDLSCLCWCPEQSSAGAADSTALSHSSHYLDLCVLVPSSFTEIVVSGSVITLNFTLVSWDTVYIVYYFTWPMSSFSNNGTATLWQVKVEAFCCVIDAALSFLSPMVNSFIYCIVTHMFLFKLLFFNNLGGWWLATLCLCCCCCSCC